MKKLTFALLLFNISINAQTREDYINYIDEYTKYKDVFETEQGSFKFSNISNKYTLILDSKFGDNSISSSCSFSENEIKKIKLVKYILDDNNKSVEIGFILNVNKCKHFENIVNELPNSKENNFISIFNLLRRISDDDFNYIETSLRNIFKYTEIDVIISKQKL
jgi:hypothetical protein